MYVVKNIACKAFKHFTIANFSYGVEVNRGSRPLNKTLQKNLYERI